MKIGVIGLGIVGNAFYEGMKHAFEVVRYDKFNSARSDVPDIETLVSETDGPIFICVPTPMKPDGSCSIEIVDEVINEISTLEYAAMCSACAPCSGRKTRVLVVKSTILPGTIRMLNYKYGESVQVVFNPEFLTEANPVEDFKKQDRIVIGGHGSATHQIGELYVQAYPGIPIVECSGTAAEMVKYVANCFLATKVSFANEIYQICDKLGVDYNTVISTATLDKRLGKSHWQVPGPDGHFGFGLTCFPKDLNALISLAESQGVDAKVMKAVWEKNLEVRPERDWEQMKGRAVL